MTLQQLRNTALRLPIRESHRIILVAPHVRIFEAEDANFHFASSVFMPMGMDIAHGGERLTVSSLESILAALRYGQSSGDPLCLAGHTDTVGSKSFNLELARDRAENVAAFVEGNKDAWVETCARHVDEDVQHLLTWAAYAHGYGCDPQGIDGKIGPKTLAALERFRFAHNQVHGTTLTVGQQPIGDDDWAAFYDLYEASATRLLGPGESDFNALRSAVKWHSIKILACGEAWPLVGRGRDELRSATNRRVEFLFLNLAVSDFSAIDQETPPGSSVYGDGGQREYVPIEPLRRPHTIKLLGGDRQPLGQRKYRLEVAGEIVEGVTGDQGEIEFQIPVTALTADLSLVNDEPAVRAVQWHLMFGPMPPVELGIGVQGRMGHLGMAAGSIRNGELDPTPDTVKAYQRARPSLSETGEVDDPTRKALDDEFRRLVLV